MATFKDGTDSDVINSGCLDIFKRTRDLGTGKHVCEVPQVLGQASSGTVLYASGTADFVINQT